MFRWLMLGICGGCLSLGALAQTEPQNTPPGQPPGERGERGDRRGPRRANVAEMFKNLPDELDMDDAQREQFAALLEECQAAALENADRAQDVRALTQELRAAREAGDSAKEEQLRNQLRELRGGQGNRFEKFMDDVESILRGPQVEKFAAVRQRLDDQMRRGPGRGMQAERTLDELRDLLKLSPEQAKTYDEMATKLRATLEGGGDMRALMQEMREARQAGDDAKVAELQRKLQEQREGRTRELEAFYNDLAGILTTDQQRVLADFRERQGRGRDGGGGPRDVENLREVLRAFRALDLTDEQRDQFKELSAELERADREARDREAKAAVAEQAKRQLSALLTPEQQQQFERTLQRGGRGAAGERRRSRDGTGPETP
jgi:hypothetical protein